MTALITLSALLGVAASYPVLTRTAKFDDALMERIRMWIEIVSRPLTLVGMILLFFLYPIGQAIVFVLGIMVAGLSPFLILLALIFPLFAGNWGDTLWLLFITIFFSYSLLGNENLKKFSFSFSWRNVAQAAAALILVSETLLWSASVGFYPRGNPSLIAALGGERAIPTLADSLNDIDAGEREREALIRFGKPVIPALMDRMEHYNFAARNSTAEIVVGLGEERTMKDFGNKGISVLIHAIAATDRFDNNTRLIESGKHHLKQLGQPVIPHLLAALYKREFNNDGQARIIETLREISGAGILSQILPAFKNLENERNQDAIATALAAFGESSIPQFMTAMESSDSWQRWWAREALEKIGRPTIPFLKAKLERPLAPYQKFDYGQAEAAIALGSLHDFSAVPLLITKLNDQSLQEDVIWALGSIGDKRAAEPLIALDRISPSSDVIEALGSIGGETATAYLTSVLVDTYGNRGDQERHSLVHRILKYESWGDRVKTLINNLHSTKEELRTEAVQNLCLIEPPNILPVLIEADSFAHNADGNCNICSAIQKHKQKINAQ